MRNYADEREIGNNYLQWTPDITNFTEVTVLIYSLEIITKVGKYFPAISLSLTSLNVLLAANDFLTNSLELGILNSLFATVGFIFLIQMSQKNKIKSSDLYYNKVTSGSFLDIGE